MSDEPSETTIFSLPPELILIVFSNIPPRELINKVSLVCRSFNIIIKDKAPWNSRIRSEANVRLPDCELKNARYDPIKTFTAIYDHKERWENWDNQKTETVLGHSATVDSVLLFNKDSQQYCLSGSRDRSIKLWNVDNIGKGADTPDNKWNISTNENTHTGWIWNMAKNENDDFYTTSWDSTVKSWQMTNTSLRNLNSVNVGSAAQCVSCGLSENEVVCTTFAKRVAVIDSRSFSIVAEHSLHKRAVIGLVVQGNSIITSGEDRILMTVDRRQMNKPVEFFYSPRAYNSYLSLLNNQLLTSTSDGRVELRDSRNLNMISSYTVGSFTRQALIDNGAHMVMARERSFKFSIYTPGTRNKLICISNDLAAEPAKFAYMPSTKTLAIGNGDSSILFCMPKTTVSEDS